MPFKGLLILQKLININHKGLEKACRFFYWKNKRCRFLTPTPTFIIKIMLILILSQNTEFWLGVVAQNETRVLGLEPLHCGCPAPRVLRTPRVTSSECSVQSHLYSVSVSHIYRGVYIWHIVLHLASCYWPLITYALWII